MRTFTLLLIATPSARSVVCPLLDSQPDMRVVAQTSSLRDARDMLAVVHADLVVLESSLGDDDGFELLPAVPISTRVILLPTNTTDTFRALGYGSLECVPLPIVPRMFLARLAAIRAGEATAPLAAMGFA